MNKYKYLLKNVGLLTISNFGTKILSFILIPIYTSYLSTAEYGTFDIYSTTIMLLIPILTINIIESVMRFSLEENIEKKDIFSIGLKYICRAILISTFLIIINFCTNIFPIFNEYILLFIALFVTEIIYDLFTQFSRGLEKVKEIAISGALNSVILLVLNIIFLVVFKLGLKGYFISYILSYFIPSIYLSLKIKIFKYCKYKTDKVVENEMKKFSKPLIFNTIGWWINNVSDRYIVTWLCGVDANGVYSVAYKIPSILNVLQSIFSQAWTLSAVKEIKNKENGFYSQIYKMYNAGFVITCSGLIVLDRIIAKILFSNEFFEAWRYAPFLMISVVFGSLSGMLGGIFSAVKDSKVFAKTTLVGSGINTVLNIVLVSNIGPLGAAIATMISYCVVWALRINKANKIVNLDIKMKRDIIIYIILLVQAILLLFVDNMYALYTFEIICTIIIIILLIKEIKLLFKKMLDFIRRKK